MYWMADDAGRIGRHVVLQRHGNIDQPARHPFLPSLRRRLIAAVRPAAERSQPVQRHRRAWRSHQPRAAESAGPNSASAARRRPIGAATHQELILAQCGQKVTPGRRGRRSVGNSGASRGLPGGDRPAPPARRRKSPPREKPMLQICHPASLDKAISPFSVRGQQITRTGSTVGALVARRRAQ